MKNVIVMHPNLNFLRKKFCAIIGSNDLELREKYSSIIEVNSRNFSIKLTIYLIKKNELTCDKFMIYSSLNISKCIMNNHPQYLRKSENQLLMVMRRHPKCQHVLIQNNEKK